MIKITATSHYASFECHFEDNNAEKAFLKVHELQESGWDDVCFEHLSGLSLDKYYKNFLQELKTIKVIYEDNRN